MISLQQILSELKAESLNEIIAGYGTPVPPCGCGSSSNSSKSSKSSHKKKKNKKVKGPKCH